MLTVVPGGRRSPAEEGPRFRFPKDGPEVWVERSRMAYLTEHMGMPLVRLSSTAVAERALRGRGSAFFIECPILSAELTKAHRYVLEVEERVAMLRGLIARLARQGHDTSLALELLDTVEQSHAFMREFERRLGD